MRYLVQWRTIAGQHTADYATERQAVMAAAVLEASGKREVVWFESMNWEAAA